MSELRNRTLVPPPPRHPAARPPSPGAHTRSSFNAPPPPVHPLHPSLPPRPQPSPRPGARSDYFSPEPAPPQVNPSLDTPHSPAIQRLPPPIPPNRPSNPRSFSENVVGSTSSVDVKPVWTTVPPPKRPIIPPELPPPVSRETFFNSITEPHVMAPSPPPPLHHATRARSLTADSAYEATLSEKELRDLYDDEEIDRFLRLFSAVRYSSLWP